MTEGSSAKPNQAEGASSPEAGARPKPLPPPRKKRRWVRFAVRVTVGAILGLPIVVLVLTQGPVAGYIVGYLVKQQLGADFTADWVSVKPDGRTVITKMQLTAPGLTGPAAQIVTANSVTVDLSFKGPLGLSITPSEIRIEQPVFRLSRSATDGQLNIEGLAIPKGQSSIAQLPRVVLKGGAIEFAEHSEASSASGATFTVLARADVDGFVDAVKPGSSDYILALKQVGGSPLGPGGGNIEIGGRINLNSGEGVIKVSGLDLSKWSTSRVPSDMRPVWEKMAMKGEVTAGEFRFTRAGTMEATLGLKDVELKVPVPAGQPQFTGGRMPFMSHVNGSVKFFQGLQGSGIEAQLTGRFEEEVQATLNFHSQGVSLDAPYSAEIRADNFQLVQEPRVLWLAPQSVREILDTFSGPTATVDARINIKRAAATADGIPDPEISGSMIFKNGSAAFDNFPYPVRELAGAVRFDDREVNIDSITGRGITGAKLFTTGRFAPPDDDAAVDLQVDLFDVPFDEHLEAAIGKSRGKDLATAVFNKDRLEEIQQRGLIITPARRQELLAEIAQAGATFSGPLATVTPQQVLTIQALAQQLQRPVFAVGGDVSRVKIHVTRPYGPAKPYSHDIDVEFKDIGLLPQIFAFPMRGKRVHLRINDQMASLTSDSLEGLEGGTATLDAQVQMVRLEEKDGAPGQMVYLPTIMLTAQALPITPLLINAIPDNAIRARSVAQAKAAAAAPAEAGNALSFSPQRVLRELGIQGTVDCQALVRPRGPETIAFDVSVWFEDLAAQPVAQPEGPQIAAAGVVGSLQVTQEGLTLHQLEGDLYMLDESAEAKVRADSGPPRDNGHFLIEGRTTFGNPEKQEPPELLATVGVERLDLTSPVDRFLRIIAPEPTVRVIELRERFKPDGRINADVQAASMRDPQNQSSLAVSATIRRTESVHIEALDGRVGVDLLQGSVTARAGGDPAAPDQIELVFDEFRADLALDDLPAGQVGSSGTLRIAPSTADQPARILVDSTFNADVRGVRLHSPAVRTLLSHNLGARSVELIKALELRGVVDGEAQLRPDLSHDGALKGDWSLHAELRPQWLGLTSRQVSVLIPEVTGSLIIDGDQGQINGLSLGADGWTAIADGTWQIVRENRVAKGVAVESSLWLNAESIPPSLIAILPQAVGDVVTQAKLRADRGVHMSDAKLNLQVGEQGLSMLGFTGDVHFEQLSADLGVQLTNATGSLNVTATKTPEQDRPQVQLRVIADQLIAAGLSVRHAQANMTTGNAAGTVEVPMFSGECYGGRLSGSARLTPPVTENAPRQYELRLQLGGVPVSDVLLALRSQPPGNLAAEPFAVGEGPSLALFAPPQPSGDTSRGWIDAELSLSGEVGDEGTRRGRGSVRITGGQVLDMPLAVRLIELGNLHLPIGEALDYFQASFWLAGNRVNFDQLGLISSNLAIMGAGQMQLPDMDLDLSVTSQSRARLPLFSDLFEMLRNEIVMARVTGTLSEPVITPEALTNTRRLIGGILGVPVAEDPGQQRQRLEQQRDRNPAAATTTLPTNR